MTHDDVVREALEWRGTPWQHQASVKHIAADCIGFIRGVGRELGMTDPFLTGEAGKYFAYGRQPDPVALREACALFLDPIELTDAIPGDLLVLTYGPDPMHFAILSENRGLQYMIHAWGVPRKVVENRIDEHFWRPKIVAAHRYKGIG